MIDSKKTVSYSDALHRKNASCRTISPAALPLRKLVAAGEIPDTAYACIAVIHFITLKRAVGEYTDSLSPEAGHRIPTGNMLWRKFGTSHTRYGRFLRNSAMNTTE